MKRRWTLIAALPPLLLAGLVPAATAAPVEANLDADLVRAEGAVSVDAPLTAFLHPFGAAAEPLLSGFDATAEHVRVETDREDTALVINDIANPHPTPETVVDEHDQATLTADAARPGHRFDVAPAGLGSATVRVESHCAALSPPDQDAVTRVAIVQFENDRPDHVIDLNDATQWMGCQELVTATIEGDFWFSAWAIDLQVQDEEGTHAYWSGHRDDQAVTQDQELYVHITNGTLQVPLLPGAGHALFLGAQGLMGVGGSLQVHNARGVMATPAGDMELGGEPITLDGALQVQSQRNQDALGIRLQGDADGAILRGTTMAFPESQENAWWPWLTALVVVAVLGVVWGYVRPLYHYHQNRVYGGDAGSLFPDSRRNERGVGYWLLAKRANKHGRNRLSLWYARRAAELFPSFPQARAMRAIQNAHLDRHEAALQDALSSYMGLRDGHERARLACLAAASAIQSDDQDAAVEWLELGAQEDPLYLKERLTRPVYQVLRSHARFRLLLDAATMDWRRAPDDPAFY